MRLAASFPQKANDLSNAMIPWCYGKENPTELCSLWVSTHMGLCGWAWVLKRKSVTTVKSFWTHNCQNSVQNLKHNEAKCFCSCSLGRVAQSPCSLGSEHTHTTLGVGYTEQHCPALPGIRGIMASLYKEALCSERRIMSELWKTKALYFPTVVPQNISDKQFGPYRAMFYF